MQSAVGRNEPCPCGSGHKYKKCCLVAREAAVRVGVDEIDVKAVVEHAIETKHWKAVDGFVERALELFVPGGPLEHVRFRDDLVMALDPESPDMTRLCSAGWMTQSELAIARVLDRGDLAPGARDGLRMAIYLLRRFGARSAIVERLGALQVAEDRARRGRFISALTSHGWTVDDLAARWTELVAWIDRARPPLLSFAEWFAMRQASAERLAEVWLATIARRVCDRCLDRLDDPALAEPAPWLQLAALTLFADAPTLSDMLLEVTPLRAPTPDEQAVHAALQTHAGPDLDMTAALQRIMAATEAAGDHRGAALVRETLHVAVPPRRG
ncbi:MAG: nucleic acid-binding protein [Myxococcales bacterium]|nr:nucleic acid-binding protein [Myxococcales bacterium]